MKLKSKEIAPQFSDNGKTLHLITAVTRIFHDMLLFPQSGARETYE